MSEPVDWEAREIVEQVAALRKAWESDSDGEEANRQVGQAAERLVTRFLLDHHRIAVSLEKIAGMRLAPGLFREPPPSPPPEGPGDGAAGVPQNT